MKQTVTKSPSILNTLDKPCLQKLLKGVAIGQRNEAALRLTVAFRKRGDSPDKALSELISWNQRNEQPLDDTEIENTCNSAFTGTYDYGCNDSLLASLCGDNCQHLKEGKSEGEKLKPRQASFVALPDGSLAELIFDPTRSKSPVFALYPPISVGSVGNVGCVGFPEVVQTKSGLILPLQSKFIVETNAVKLPSGVEEYGTEEALVAEIDHFIRSYLSVSEPFHTITKYYVLFTWVYDRFSELPYLRALGDYGTGKSRFLMTVGSLCYKPTFMMGATSIASIFRLQDIIGGTLILDEGDVGRSDESHLFIKLLNTGYQKAFPLFRCETGGDKTINLACFNVFGPKIIATRKNFGDQALESRCLTEHMDGKWRGGLPLNITEEFWEKACSIRNKCLLWRFRNYHSVPRQFNDLPPNIHPRLAQILIPLASIIEDQNAVKQLTELIVTMDADLKDDQLETNEGQVARVIIELKESTEEEKLSIQQITEKVNESIRLEKHHMTNQKVGRIISKSLGLPKVRSADGSFIIVDSPETVKTIEYLRRKYGL